MIYLLSFPGFFSPSRGKIIVKGKNIFDDMDEFRSSLGLCHQHNLVFSYFTVLDHLVFFGMVCCIKLQPSYFTQLSFESGIS